MVIAKQKDVEIEVKDLEDLYRLTKEARARDEPLIIQSDHGDEIVFNPAPRRRNRRTKAEREKADEEAFLAAAGGWKGLIDGEQLKRQIKAARGSNRPPVDLTRLGA